jgi:glycosyltransferase involved in cell wall biosynthesis
MKTTATAESQSTRPSLGANVVAIIPCLDEEQAIASVVAAVLAQGVSRVIVVDGHSHDRTVERATTAGARVIVESQRGYGRAIAAGIAAAPAEAEILLFLDGDGSDRLEFIPALIAPIVSGRAAFTHGSRVCGTREPGSLSWQQIAAGRLAGFLLRLLYGARFTDMSPFRAIRRDTLNRLGMRETTYGWNLEMQMHVAAAGIATEEIAVGHRRRMGGKSKVSGNLAISLRAACRIIATFARLAATLRRGPLDLQLTRSNSLRRMPRPSCGAGNSRRNNASRPRLRPALSSTKKNITNTRKT